MNWFLRGALSLVLAASAGVALAQPYPPPPAGYQGLHQPPLAGAARDMERRPMRDGMPGPDGRAGPPLEGHMMRHEGHMMGHGGSMMGPDGCREEAYYRCGYDRYGFSRQGVTRDGYDIFGYDADGYDRYGFDVEGFTRDGYDRFGYDQNGLDRYGRRAPTRYGQAAPDREPGPERDPAGPPPMRYGQGGPGQIVHPYLDHDPYDRDRSGRGRYDGYREGQYGYERYSYGERAPDRYGPPPRDYWDEPADGYYVPSFGGPLQHYGDPHCNTCRVPPRDCGCHGDHVGMSSISISPYVFYDGGGVGPIPDGGSYGGGGYVIMGGRAGASSSSSASAYASSSSRVSVSVRGGGHKGGCHSCGGHR